MKKDLLILVDKDDREIGTGEKEACHLGGGKLHRAFSIFVSNDKCQLLLQKRAKDKMLWPGYWTNTCCSHPRKGETIEQAAHRRLEEELGFDCALKEIFKFTYHAKFRDIGSENEVDHVLVGTYNGKIKPNPEEVMDWKWAGINSLLKDSSKNPQNYTPWFLIAIEELVERGILKRI